MSYAFRDSLHLSVVEDRIEVRLNLRPTNLFVDENDEWIGFRLGMKEVDHDDDAKNDDADDDDDEVYVKFSEIIAMDAASIRACGE